MQSIQKDHAVPLIPCQRHVEVEKRWLEGAGGGGGFGWWVVGVGRLWVCKQTNQKDPRRLQEEVRIDRTLERSTGEGHAHEEVKCPADQRHVGTRGSQTSRVPTCLWRPLALLSLIGFRANNREQFHVFPLKVELACARLCRV